MLRTRVITALLLIILVAVPLAFCPPQVFQLLILGAVFFALAEFFRMTLPRGRWYRVIGLTFGMLVAVVQSRHGIAAYLDLLLMGGLFAMAMLLLWHATTFERYAVHLGLMLFGVVYIALTLPYIGLIRQLAHGRALVVATLAMVALSDTAAYTVGRTLGRRKLAALASPNKTLEGFFGGFLGSLGGLLLCRALFWPEMPLVAGIGLALVIGFVAPMGDLIESALKRGAHVKDSGRMLPGHGGMLDRCDAYFFSGPVVYYYVKWVMGL